MPALLHRLQDLSATTGVPGVSRPAADPILHFTSALLITTDAFNKLHLENYHKVLFYPKKLRFLHAPGWTTMGTIPFCPIGRCSPPSHTSMGSYHPGMRKMMSHLPPSHADQADSTASVLAPPGTYPDPVQLSEPPI